MTQSATALVVAAIAAIVSLGSTVWVERRSRRSSRELAELGQAHQQVLEKYKDELLRGRDSDAKASEARQLVNKYRDPLLHSANDLQSRVYNVLRIHGFRGRRDHEYFRLNTLFVIAEFLGWLEIIRREMQFLDLGATGETRELGLKLFAIQDRLASTSSDDDEHYIYKGQQRAIGELMISRPETNSTAGPRHECMGYASFVAKQQDAEFARWFERLGEAIEDLPRRRPRRLVAVQRALIELIDFLDPDHVRIVSAREQLPIEP